MLHHLVPRFEYRFVENKENVKYYERNIILNVATKQFVISKKTVTTYVTFLLTVKMSITAGLAVSGS
jgi:hypothetical protein